MNLVPSRAAFRHVLRVASFRQTRKLSRYQLPLQSSSIWRTTQWFPTKNRVVLGQRTFLSSVFGSKIDRESFSDVLDYLSDASRKVELRIRPPPRAELAEKLDIFFSKLQSKHTTVTDYQVLILKPLLSYLWAGKEDASEYVLLLPKWMSSLGINPKVIEQEITKSTTESSNITHDSNLAPLADIMLSQLKEAWESDRLASKVRKVLGGLESGFDQLKVQENLPPADETLILLSRQLNEMRAFLRQGDFDSAVAFWETFDSGTLGLLGDKKKSPFFETPPKEIVGELIRGVLRPGSEVDVDLLKSLKSWNDSFIGRYDPETLSALARYYLIEEEHKLAIEDIKSSIPFMSVSQRLGVMGNLQSFGFSRLEASDVETAWHVCNLLIRLFSDVPRGILVQFMLAFLNVGQIEYGMHMFQFLRNSHRADRRPDETVYIILLRNFMVKPSGSATPLRKIHNQLKIDTNVDPSTDLYDTLMASYLQAGLFDNALGVWEEYKSIGLMPTVTTYQMAIWLNGLASSTLQSDVDELWKEIESQGIDEKHPNLLCTYIGTLAFTGRKLKAMKIIKELEFPEALSSLYYASMDDPDVRQWIESEYPEEMDKVLSDRSTEITYSELVTARLRGQGLFDDEMDSDDVDSRLSRQHSQLS